MFLNIKDKVSLKKEMITNCLSFKAISSHKKSKAKKKYLIK